MKILIIIMCIFLVACENENTENTNTNETIINLQGFYSATDYSQGIDYAGNWGENPEPENEFSVGISTMFIDFENSTIHLSNGAKTVQCNFFKNSDFKITSSHFEILFFIDTETGSVLAVPNKIHNDNTDCGYLFFESNFWGV